MALFHRCLTVGPIQLFISYYLLKSSMFQLSVMTKKFYNIGPRWRKHFPWKLSSLNASIIEIVMHDVYTTISMSSMQRSEVCKRLMPRRDSLPIYLERVWGSNLRPSIETSWPQANLNILSPESRYLTYQSHAFFIVAYFLSYLSLSISHTFIYLPTVALNKLYKHAYAKQTNACRYLQIGKNTYIRISANTYISVYSKPVCIQIRL